MLPFNVIRIRADGITKVVSLDAFLAIPIFVRVELLLEHRVEFLQDNKLIDPRVALSALRKRTAEL